MVQVGRILHCLILTTKLYQHCKRITSDNRFVYIKVLKKPNDKPSTTNYKLINVPAALKNSPVLSEPFFLMKPRLSLPGDEMLCQYIAALALLPSHPHYKP